MSHFYLYFSLQEWAAKNVALRKIIFKTMETLKEEKRIGMTQHSAYFVVRFESAFNGLEKNKRKKVSWWLLSY